MKKSLIFWLAAATCAAWILVGCEQEPETKTVTVTNGAAADIEGLQALLAEPGVNQVTYYGDLTITGGKLVSVPEGKTLTVTGGITLAGASDVLVVAGGLNFTGTITNSGVVIGVAADKVSGGTTGAIVSGLDDPKIGTVSAMKDYTLTSNASAIPNTLTLYVYGNLTVAADSVAPTGGGKVVAIGTVTLAGDNAAALADAAKVDVGNATITYGGTSTVAITLPATLSSPTFKVTGNGGVLKVVGTTNVTANVTANNGYVEFAGAVTAATITGGGRVRFANGTTPTGFTTASDITASVIEFPNGFSYGTATLALSGDVYIGDGKAATATGGAALTLGSGTVVQIAGTPATTLLTAADEVTITPTSGAILTFTAASGLALSTQGVAFGGDVVFGGDLTVSGVTAEFGGTAYFAATKKITLVDTSSAIKLAGVAGALAVGAPVANVPDIYHTVLIGNDSSNGGTLTAAAASTTLTFGATGITQDGEITITNKVAVIPVKSYTVEAEGTLTVDSNAVLALDAGVLADYDEAPAGKPTEEADYLAKLILTGADDDDGAKLTGAGSVAFGNASITGGASGVWQAVGDSTSITIAVEAITGTGTGAALTGATNDSAVITLAKGHTDGDGAALIVTNVTIDLATNGAVVFPYVDTTAATLVLKGGTGAVGALKLNTGTTTNTNVNLKDGSHSVTISGTGAVIQGASESAAAVAGLISGGAATPGNDATITGKTTTDDVTVKKGATLESSSS